MTPCEKLGYKIGDKFKEVETEWFDMGAEIILVVDDGTQRVKFEGLHGGCAETYWVYLHNVVKVGEDVSIVRTNESTPPIQATVAVSPSFAIGYGDKLLYTDSRDLSFFSGFTQGKTCIVGHNTLQTLPTLRGRNVVEDSRDTFPLVCLNPHQQKVVIGGGKTYTKYAPQVDELYLTQFLYTSEAEKVVDKDYLVYFDMAAYSHLTKREQVLKNDKFVVYKYYK